MRPQRNSYCSLKAPSLLLVLEILTPNLFIHCFQQMSASGPRFTARMASRQTLHRKLGKSAGNGASTTYEALSGALSSIYSCHKRLTVLQLVPRGRRVGTLYY